MTEKLFTGTLNHNQNKTNKTDAFQDVDAGFPIRHRFDGKLLNLRRPQAKSKVQTDVVDKLLYANDPAENAKSEEKCKGL